MRAPSSSTRRQAGRQRVPARDARVVRQPVRRHLAGREVQPLVTVRPEAGGVRHTRPDQAADGQRRRGRCRHRQDGLRLRRDRQQGNQRARRAIRLRRHDFPRQPRRGRDFERFRYGFGLGMPSRKGLRLTAELHGEVYSDDTVTLALAADSARSSGRMDRSRRSPPTAARRSPPPSA